VSDKHNNGKGDKTAGRTNHKAWNKSKALPERIVKTWPRDNNGKLIEDRKADHE